MYTSEKFKNVIIFPFKNGICDTTDEELSPPALRSSQMEDAETSVKTGDSPEVFKMDVRSPYTVPEIEFESGMFQYLLDIHMHIS
jgi:hypothetical protein